MFNTTDLCANFNPSDQMRKSHSEGEFTPSFTFDEAIKNIRFDISSVKIKRRKELVGKAEIYLAWIVVDDQSEEPIKMGSSDLFRGVQNGDLLPLGPGGLTIYRNDKDKLPHFLDYRILVLESDKGVRDMAATFDEIRNMDGFKESVNALLKVTSLGVPQVALVTAATDFALNMTSKLAGLNQDDQLILIQGSYDRLFDDLESIYGKVKQQSRYAEVLYEVKAK